MQGKNHPANQVDATGWGGVSGMFHRWERYGFRRHLTSPTFTNLTFMPDFTLGGEEELRHANFVPLQVIHAVRPDFQASAGRVFGSGSRFLIPGHAGLCPAGWFQWGRPSLILLQT